MTYRERKFYKTYPYKKFKDFIGYRLDDRFISEAYADFLIYTLSHTEPMNEALELWAGRLDNKYID